MVELSLMRIDEIYQYNKHNSSGDPYKNSVNNIAMNAYLNNKPIHRTLVHSGVGGFNPLYSLSYVDMMNNGYTLIDELYVK